MLVLSAILEQMPRGPAACVARSEKEVGWDFTPYKRESIPSRKLGGVHFRQLEENSLARGPCSISM